MAILFQLLSLGTLFLEERLMVSLDIVEQILDVSHLQDQALVEECCSFFSIVKLSLLRVFLQSQLCLILIKHHNVSHLVSMSYDVESIHNSIVGKFHDMC